MRNATERLILLVLAAGATTACAKEQPQNDANVVITENVPANAAVEALPPDESAPPDDANADDGAGAGPTNVTNADGNGY